VILTHANFFLFTWSRVAVVAPKHLSVVPELHSNVEIASECIETKLPDGGIVSEHALLKLSRRHLHMLHLYKEKDLECTHLSLLTNHIGEMFGLKWKDIRPMLLKNLSLPLLLITSV
jgi:hypothetical protein